MQKRRRFKHPNTLIARLTSRAAALRELAGRLPIGEEQTSLLANAERCDRAAEIDGWLRSKELEPPR